MVNYGATNSRIPFDQLPDPTPYFELLETIGEGKILKNYPSMVPRVL